MSPSALGRMMRIRFGFGVGTGEDGRWCLVGEIYHRGHRGHREDLDWGERRKSEGEEGRGEVWEPSPRPSPIRMGEGGR